MQVDLCYTLTEPAANLQYIRILRGAIEVDDGTGSVCVKATFVIFLNGYKLETLMHKCAHLQTENSSIYLNNM